jgi:hypothetical protein
MEKSNEKKKNKYAENMKIRDKRLIELSIASYNNKLAIQNIENALIDKA